jgi:hypothetical protein
MEQIIVVSNISSFTEYIPRSIQKVGALVESDSSPKASAKKSDDNVESESINVYFDPSTKTYWYENPTQTGYKHILSIKPISANIMNTDIKFHIDEMPGHLYEFRMN